LHREKNLFPRVVDFGNLYRALRGASHGKREQPEVREFEYHDRPRTDARLAVQPPVIAVDTNLLAYAHRRGVAEHRVAQRVIERASRDVRGWGISSEGLPTQAPPGGGMLVWTPGVGFDERLLQLATDLNVTGPRIFHL
jgi:hypothetical protein